MDTPKRPHALFVAHYDPPALLGGKGEASGLKPLIATCIAKFKIWCNSTWSQHYPQCNLVGVTSLEVMYQITCIFFWSFKRLYTTFYFLTCSSTPQDLNKKILFYKNESKSIMYITFKWIRMTWPHFIERERHTPFCPFFGRPHWTQQNPFFHCYVSICWSISSLVSQSCVHPVATTTVLSMRLRFALEVKGL